MSPQEFLQYARALGVPLTPASAMALLRDNFRKYSDEVLQSAVRAATL